MRILWHRSQNCFAPIFFTELTNHPFFNDAIDCPEPDMDKLDDKLTTTETAKAVWVPNRNGIFLNIAAALAESQSINSLYVGFNAEEAVTFPDNSLDYVNSMNQSLSFSTLNKVKITAPTINMVKKEIFKELFNSDFPVKYLWSCYNNYEKMCGKCESCQRLKRAMIHTQTQNTKYENLFIR